MNLLDFALCSLLLDKCLEKSVTTNVVFMGTWRIGLLFDNDNNLSLFNTTTEPRLVKIRNINLARTSTYDWPFRVIDVADPQLGDLIDELLSHSKPRKIRLECRSEDVFNKINNLKKLKEGANK